MVGRERFERSTSGLKVRQSPQRVEVKRSTLPYITINLGIFARDQLYQKSAIFHVKCTKFARNMSPWGPLK